MNDSLLYEMWLSRRFPGLSSAQLDSYRNTYAQAFHETCRVWRYRIGTENLAIAGEATEQTLERLILRSARIN